MSGLPHLLVAGLATGSLYALLSLSLALGYQVSGVINFAQGAFATVGAYLLWSLLTNSGLPFVAAIALTLLFTFALGALLQVVLLRPLGRQATAASLVVTLGLLSVTEGVVGQVWGVSTQFFSLPISVNPVQLGTVFIGGTDLLTIVLTLLLIAIFFIVLRTTTVGMVLRAVAQSPRGARLVGVRVDRVVLGAWGVSAALSAVAGVLIAARPTPLTPSMADLYLLTAFAGAMIGGLDSLPGAALAALVLGVVQNLVGAYLSLQWRNAVVFILLLVVLLLRPSGVFGQAVQRRV